MDFKNVVSMYLHTMECYSVIKEKEILSFAAMWRKVEGINLCEISQTERKLLYDLTYM